MNKIICNSFNLFNALPLNSINCRNFCRICLNKSNNYKLNYLLNNCKPNQINTIKTTLSFKSNPQNFLKKFNFSTTSQRSQRLNQIHRNEIKDKSSKAPKPEEINEWQKLRQLSLTKKLKFMFTKYWYISIPVHFVTSCLWFGSSYLIAKSGFDVKPILEWIRPYAEKLPLPDFLVKVLNSDTNASSAGYLAIALIIYKLVTPARYATTVGVSFYAIQFSVKRGLIRPAPSGQQIKAQVNKSRSKLNKVLRERLAKREEMRKKSKPKKH